MSAPAMTLTESVRARLYKVAGACPTCKGPGMSVRAIAKASGCTAATVHRFMRGKPVSSTHLDVIAAWVSLQERQPGRPA